MSTGKDVILHNIDSNEVINEFATRNPTKPGKKISQSRKNNPHVKKLIILINILYNRFIEQSNTVQLVTVNLAFVDCR